MEVNHYDENGSKVGHSSQGDDLLANLIFALIAIAIIVGIAGLILYLLFDFLSNWQSLDAPYNYAAGFYNYVIVKPCYVIKDALLFIYNYSFTSYLNMNLVIATVLALIALAGVGFIAFQMAIRSIRGYSLLRISLVFFSLPMFFGILWFLGSSLVNWLFMQ